MEQAIPQYCGLTGCWQESQLTGHDEVGHPIHACSPAHKLLIAIHRTAIYQHLMVNYWIKPVITVAA